MTTGEHYTPAYTAKHLADKVLLSKYLRSRLGEARPRSAALNCSPSRLRQEFIMPTPEQNEMIERFFRPLKEECTWQTN